MSVINVHEIKEAVRHLCIETNIVLSEDMEEAIQKAGEKEVSILGKKIISQLNDNIVIAKKERIPICQDTGMVIVFIEIGQEVHIQGGNLEEAIQQGIREGYEDGYLRKSVVQDPILRVNTNDNTPGIIHYSIVDGNQIKITVAPKGFGSENMSRIFMLKPSDGMQGIIKVIVNSVEEAGSNPCPPIIVGVGIGGSFEKCAYLAKKALLRKVGQPSDKPHLADLEQEALKKINQLGIGPQGFGGTLTALAVHIDSFPTHIASMPVAVNICCHVNRHGEIIL